jgi:hypothetical protein
MPVGGKYIEEFAAFLGWEIDSKELEKFDKQVDEMKKGVESAGKTILKAAGAVSALAGTVAGLITLTNKATAEKANLAESVGLSAENVDALSSVIENLGFDFEKTIDLVEELNNKIGEMKGLGEMSSVQDSIRMLGLEWKELSKLSPEDQFIEVLDAAKNLEDQQRAVSAVDMLMGGDANRILGFLRTQEGSLREILERRKQLIMLDKEGREGAKLFNEVMIQARTVVQSLIAQFSGLAGEALVPIISQFTDWVIQNKELIKTRLREWVDRVVRGLIWFTEKALKLYFWIKRLTDSLGGLENTVKLLVLAFLSLKAAGIIIWFGKLVVAMRSAGTAGLLMNLKIAALPVLLAAAIVLAILILEDFYRYLTGGDSVIGRLIPHLEGIYDEMIKVAEQYIDDAITQWSDWLGVSKEDLDKFLIDSTDAVSKFFIDLWNWFVELPDRFRNALDDAFNTFSVWISKIKAGAAEIPIIGGLFRGETTIAPPTPTGGLRPSPALAGAGGTGGTTTNSAVTNNNINMKITQLPGESGEDFANRVGKVIEEKAAVAARNNSTGVIY